MLYASNVPGVPLCKVRHQQAQNCSEQFPASGRFWHFVPIAAMGRAFPASRYGVGPLPVFVEVRILKELWIEVLQVQIVKGLWEDDCG
jgi:hypothetical protein